MKVAAFLLLLAGQQTFAQTNETWTFLEDASVQCGSD
jgi:hypothetical protein